MHPASSLTKTDTIDRYKAKIKAATHKIEAVRAKIDKLIGDRPADYDIDAVAAAIDDMTDGNDTKRQRVRDKQRRLKEIATEINCNIRALAAAMVGKKQSTRARRFTSGLLILALAMTLSMPRPQLNSRSGLGTPREFLSSILQGGQ